MKAKTNVSKTKSRRGFTLVEMLVVIGMIAALAGISFPVYRSIQKKVERQALQMLINSYERAVDNFETEYNYLPYIEADYPAADSLYKNQDGDVRSFVTVLVGLGDTCNFKQIKFIEGPAPKSGSAGLEISGATATLIDPWGNEFQRIRVDRDNDGIVPWHYSALDGEEFDPCRKRVTLISFGPDGAAGSWQGGTHLDNLHNFPTPWD